MCFVSTVMDAYAPKIPPIHTVNVTFTEVTTTDEAKKEREELREIINEFREAVEAATKLDVLLKQPDCEDPDKTKLIERVNELERRLNAIDPPKKKRGKK